MSYDLMVFDCELAPAKGEIESWFIDSMDADSSDRTLDPDSVSSVRLRAFYEDMRVNYPAMNGPDRTDNFGPTDTDYAFHLGFINMAFAGSIAHHASEAVRSLAKKYGLGLFDPQDPDDGVMWMGTTAN